MIKSNVRELQVGHALVVSKAAILVDLKEQLPLRPLQQLRSGVSNERETHQADDPICPATLPFLKVFAEVVPIFEETINLEIKIVALVQSIVDLASLYERIHNIDISKVRWYSLLRQPRYLLRLPGFALPFPVLNLSRVPVA
jgi:hypothetical protein